MRHSTIARRVAFSLLIAAPATFAPLSAGGAQAAAQQPQQPDFRWEKALSAGSMVSLHNLNGDVSVAPSTNGKVEVVGVKRGSRRYFDEVTLEVVETSRGIVVCSMFKSADMECNEDGFHVHNDRHRGWRDRDSEDVSIDIVVKIPKEMVVSAGSVSGSETARTPKRL